MGVVRGIVAAVLRGIVRGVVPGEGGASGPLVYDTFTDSDNVFIPSHTPEIDAVGGGWLALGGDADDPRILSNRLDSTNFGIIGSAIDVGANEYVASVVFGSVNMNNLRRIGPMVRNDGATTQHGFWVAYNDNTNALEMLEFPGSTLRASTAISPALAANVDHALVVTVTITDIVGVLNGVDSVSYTSSAKNDKTFIELISHGPEPYYERVEVTP